MSAQKATTKTRKSTTTPRGKTAGLTAEERAAMKAYLKEQKAAGQKVGSIALVHETLSRTLDEQVDFDEVADRIGALVAAFVPRRQCSMKSCSHCCVRCPFGPVTSGPPMRAVGSARFTPSAAKS